MHKGASDWFIAYPSNGYYGLWIEIKPEGWSGPKGQLQQEHHQRQINFIKRMRAQGYAAEMCVGLDQIIKTVTEYLS